ncbi:hypothetical protein [Fulvimarina manganoxydans]|uniref:hypothetical protein n=1 Tax=Fulvimarina manganoxydans TaxID=937218 RepID=UPI00111C2722|nr:hypothetical protein [Fulvimarina manganoxydans]
MSDFSGATTDTPPIPLRPSRPAFGGRLRDERRLPGGLSWINFGVPVWGSHETHTVSCVKRKQPRIAAGLLIVLKFCVFGEEEAALIFA